jgi:hypothetical protein
VREEQRQKAAEAEARKKRRQEQQVKKAAAAKQKAAEQAAAAAAAPPVVSSRAVAAPVAAAAADEIEGASGTDGEGEGAEEQAVVQQQVKQRKGDNKHLPAKAKQQLAAAGRKPLPIKKPAKVQKWHQQYSTEMAVAAVALLMLVLMLLWLTTK